MTFREACLWLTPRPVADDRPLLTLLDAQRSVQSTAFGRVRIHDESQREVAESVVVIADALAAPLEDNAA